MFSVLLCRQNPLDSVRAWGEWEQEQGKELRMWRRFVSQQSGDLQLVVWVSYSSRYLWPTFSSVLAWNYNIWMCEVALPNCCAYPRHREPSSSEGQYCPQTHWRAQVSPSVFWWVQDPWYSGPWVWSPSSPQLHFSRSWCVCHSFWHSFKAVWMEAGHKLLSWFL